MSPISIAKAHRMLGAAIGHIVIGRAEETEAGAEADVTVAEAAGADAVDADVTEDAAVMVEVEALAAVGTKPSWPRIYADLRG